MTIFKLYSVDGYTGDEYSEKIGIIHKTISEIGHEYRKQDSIRDGIMSNFKKIVDIFIWKKEE